MSRSVARQAAKKTGLDSDLLMKMLPVIATMVMGSLSKRSQEPDVMSQLIGMLGGAKQQPKPQAEGLGGLLAGLLGGGRNAPSQRKKAHGLEALFDADGDGSAMDDIFQMVLKGRS